MRQSLDKRVPITPVVSVGAHETLFVLARGHELAKKLGLSRILRVDVLPFWLGLPFGIGWGPIPNLPLPSKIKLEVAAADPAVEGAGESPTRTTGRRCERAWRSCGRACRTSRIVCTPSGNTRSSADRIGQGANSARSRGTISPTAPSPLTLPSICLPVPLPSAAGPREHRDVVARVARHRQPRAVAIIVELEQAQRRKIAIELVRRRRLVEAPARLAPGRADVHEQLPVIAAPPARAPA